MSEESTINETAFFLSTNSGGGFISRKRDDAGRILTRAAKSTAAGQKTSVVLRLGGVSLRNNDGVFALNLAGCGRLNIFFAFAGFFVKRIPVFKRCLGIGMQRFFEIFADVCVFFQKTGKINGCGFFAAVGFDERQVEAVTFFSLRIYSALCFLAASSVRAFSRIRYGKDL